MSLETTVAFLVAVSLPVWLVVEEIVHRHGARLRHRSRVITAAPVRRRIDNGGATRRRVGTRVPA
jgi:hypothetical protein